MAPRRSHAAKHVTAPRALPGSLSPFDVRAFLDSAGISRRIVRCARASVVFAQGGPANSVFYIEHGGVKLSVLSRKGREAIVAMLAPGDFFGKAVWPDNLSGSARRPRWCRRPCCGFRKRR